MKMLKAVEYVHKRVSAMNVYPIIKVNRHVNMKISCHQHSLFTLLSLLLLFWWSSLLSAAIKMDLKPILTF